MPRPSRRDLFRAAPLAAVPLLAGRASGQSVPPQPGMTVRMHEPRNLETPISHLTPPSGPLLQGSGTGGPQVYVLNTATDHFYVRSHFAVPAIDLKTWKLKVEGHVENPVEFTLDDLKKLTGVSKSLTMECAGNGRVFLTPAVRGLQWGFGGVGTAEWNGIALASVLEKAVPKKGAVDVVLIGADKGAINVDPPSPGPIHFDRGIPIEKAMKPESVLAWGMNGKELTPAHGFPLRAVIGGWYGMAAVKWLTRIVVTDKPHDGFWQTFDYSYFTRTGDLPPSLTPVTKVQPKAVITSHVEGGEVKAGTETSVSGLAWSGEAAAKAVEFSDDGGATWAKVELDSKADPFVWQPWAVKWTPKQKGTTKLLARCTDTAGATQPDKRDIDRRTYMINHLVPVEVVVK
jgi:DMSO/TMAO reductase YedYZ molybdopterin-dependent catalytic subunit